MAEPRLGLEDGSKGGRPPYIACPVLWLLPRRLSGAEPKAWAEPLRSSPTNNGGFTTDEEEVVVPVVPPPIEDGGGVL